MPCQRGLCWHVWHARRARQSHAVMSVASVPCPAVLCCAAQVNLDFESEADMVDKFRIGLALQPIAVALFANSPFVEGQPSGMLSTRGEAHMWALGQGCVGTCGGTCGHVGENIWACGEHMWGTCQNMWDSPLACSAREVRGTLRYGSDLYMRGSACGWVGERGPSMVLACPFAAACRCTCKHVRCADINCTHTLPAQVTHTLCLMNPQHNHCDDTSAESPPYM
jgi:hypothetical protein